MKGFVLLYYFFSSNIFFCTLSLFSLSYTGGGAAYTIYSICLAIMIGFVLFLGFLKNLFLRGDFKISKSVLFVVFLLFVLFLNIIWGYFYYRTDPSIRMFEYFSAMTVPAVFMAIITKEKDIQMFYKLLKYLNIYLTICIVIAFFKTKGTGVFNDIGGTSYQEIGYTMAILFSYNFIKFIKEKGFFKRFFHVLMMSCNVSLIFLSGARGALISACVSFIFMYFLFIVKSRKAVRNTIVLSIFAYIAVLFLNHNSQYTNAFWRMSLLFQSDLGITSSGRDIYYQQAISQFQDNPIFGNGMFAFTNSFGIYVYPHNIILEIMNNFGIVGLIFAFFISILLFAKSIKMIKHSDHYQYMVILFIQTMTSLMISGSYLTEIQFWIPFVIIFTFANKTKVKRTVELDMVNDKVISKAM